MKGLLGTPNGAKDNDWPNKDGTYNSLPTTLKERTRSKTFNWCTQNWCLGHQESSLLDDNNFEKYNYCDNAYDPTDEGMLDSVLPNIEVGCNEFAKKSNGDFIDALSACLIDSMVDRETAGGDGMGFIDDLMEQREKHPICRQLLKK